MSGTDPPVRVLHLITRFLDGGAETTTLHALDALERADRSYDLRLGVGAEHDRERLRRIEDRGIDVETFGLIRHYNLPALVLSVGQVARYLRREDIDVLHTHSTEAGIVGRVAGALANVPVVIHEIHGDPITEDRTRLLNELVERLERVCAPLSTALIVKSSVIEDTYLDRGIGEPERYELIYHGVDVEPFRVATPAANLATDERVVLTFVGRLVKGKGLFDLLDAIERLDGRVRLLVVGEGPLAESLRREIETRGLEESVRLLGYRDDIPAVLAATDVFVLPSYREGTPRAITEALAAGVPVVSTAIAGIPEQVTDGVTGYLVRPGETDALVERLQRLVDDRDLRASMGQAAAGSVETFRKAAAAERYRALYDRLLAERGYGTPSDS